MYVNNNRSCILHRGIESFTTHCCSFSSGHRYGIGYRDFCGNVHRSKTPLWEKVCVCVCVTGAWDAFLSIHLIVTNNWHLPCFSFNSLPTAAVLYPVHTNSTLDLCHSIASWWFGDSFSSWIPTAKDSLPCRYATKLCRPSSFLSLNS